MLEDLVLDGRLSGVFPWKPCHVCSMPDLQRERETSQELGRSELLSRFVSSFSTCPKKA